MRMTDTSLRLPFVLHKLVVEIQIPLRVVLEGDYAQWAVIVNLHSARANRASPVEKD